MRTSTKWVRQQVDDLLRIAQRLAPEGEGIDLTDKGYAMEDIAEIRSFISRQRKAIDIISAALAVAWDTDHGALSYDDGTNTWSVGRTKGKRIIDDEQFYKWLATKDADQLAKLVSASAVKVGGMSPVERETLIDETPHNDKLFVKSKPNDM